MKKISVICPHCGKEQQESEAAISSVCRSCGTYIRVQERPKRKVERLAAVKHYIVCDSCGHEQRVVPDALSSQCERCANFLNLRHYEIRGISTEKIKTSGRARFLAGCDYRATDVRAHLIEIFGSVTARVLAQEVVMLLEDAVVNGRIEAPAVRVETRARSRATRIETETMEVMGAITLRDLQVTGTLRVGPSGSLRCDRIIAPSIEVEKGGSVRGIFQTSAWLELHPEALLPNREDRPVYQS